MNLSFLEVIHNGGLSADQAENVQLIFRKKSKASSSASPPPLSQNDYPSDLLTPCMDSPGWLCRLILVAPRRPAGHRQGLYYWLLQAISSLISLICPHWEICLLSAQIFSAQGVAVCQWGCLLRGEPANHFGSELIVIYLECEHLSEAADGGSRVELPEPRAGSVSFKCKARAI